MHRELDDNFRGGHHKKHDRDCDQDIDININVNVNNDNDWTSRRMGGLLGDHLDRLGDPREPRLNLCDVASGIGDIVSSIGRDAAAIGRGAGVAKFNEIEQRRDELPYIDCEWGRLLDQNKEAMLLKSAKLSAALKDSEG